MPDPIHSVHCPECDHAAEGPDLVSVQEANDRHQASKHTQKPKPKRTRKKKDD